MHQLSRNGLFFIYKQFKSVWIFLTILCFFIFSYVNCKIQIYESLSTASKTACQLKQNIDKVINNIFIDINKIPLCLDQNVACKNNIISYLQHIDLNYPQVSGIAIWDPKSHITYSTLPHEKSFVLKHKPFVGFTGPLVSPLFQFPIYVVQRKIENYNAEIIIISPVIRNILKSYSNNLYSISLKDELHKKIILKVERPKKTSVFAANIFEMIPNLDSQQITATARLNSIDGLVITVIEKKQNVRNAFFYSELLLSADILILFLFLYFIIKNLLTKHYSLHGALKKAIKKEQFYPVYQPLYDAKNDVYSGAEVLLRWNYYEDKIIMPDLFIEEAEDSGLIIPITLQIVETAFKETKELFHTIPTFHLAFNLCAFHFQDSHFFNQFFKLITKYSISPHQILLEITERYLLDVNNKTFIKRMQELRELGYSLAIDDYGTGHSSISYLQSYPFNYLKIDKIFIQAIGTKAITETLNDAIIHLAKKMNLIIIAEGVETQEQVNFLVENEVHFLQGWYFSKAISINQLIKLLKPQQ